MGHYSSVRHEALFVCTRGSCLPDVPKLFGSVQSIERARFEPPDGYAVSGLSALLARRMVRRADPMCLALHLIYPRFQFLDRGKGSVALASALDAAVGKAVIDVTKEWHGIQKRRERDRQQANRMAERYSRGKSERVSIKDAAYAGMVEAYNKASGNGQYPAAARQIMYAARGRIQEVTGETLNDVYFTQTLLPDYMSEHPEQAANWDVVYGARGHLLEPHTGHEVGLGTLGVREYLGAMRVCRPDFDFSLPGVTQCKTRGPHGRYGAVLYIEKEGFIPLLLAARIAGRYDLAIMSSKGMGTTAARTLIEQLSREVKILVLHDFDKAGFSIAGTLTRDTRRYNYAKVPEIIDLGLRLDDVKAWNLTDEDVDYGKGDPTGNLKLNGATDEEIRFLLRRRDIHSGHYIGRRVELNAFTSPDFIAWLEGKLKEHQIEKVVPDTTTLEKALRRAAGITKLRELMEGAQGEADKYAKEVEVPANIDERVKGLLKENPDQPWDEVIKCLLSGGKQNETT
jgi:hypothetical protein